MSTKGRFIAVEGLEGAGKSTAMSLIEEQLLSANVKQIIMTREPGGTQTGEVIRKLLKGEKSKEHLYGETELLLFYAARTQLVNQVIKPALQEGTWVIADRFELSTYAYQGAGRGLDLQFINTLSNYCLKGFGPDLTLYLDISPDLGLQRVKQRGATDRIEQEPLEFFNKIRQYFISHVACDSRSILIDASQSLERVQQDLTQSINQFLNQCRACDE